MTFYYDAKQHPTVILDSQTSRKLLLAIREGCIDMAYFPELYHPNNRESGLYPNPNDEEQIRVPDIAIKLQETTVGQAVVILPRELKLRLLKAIRANELNLLSDFPELAKAYQSVKMDFSIILKEDYAFILDYCRKRG